jgi:hypothetical protein
LFNNISGSYNTATGFRALYENNGSQNTATGFSALGRNRGGEYNTADGYQALGGGTSGGFNVATSFFALLNNNGNNNTGVGAYALVSNTTGISNTAIGYEVMHFNTSGRQNTAAGDNALSFNRTGGDNTAIGASALAECVAGNFNIALWIGAGGEHFFGDNNIYVGNPGVADTESGTVRIGTAGTHTQTFIAGITGTAVSGTAVVVDENGQLGVAASSKRFKDEIKPMNKASEAILALKPVTFRYKAEIDPKRAPQFGLVAEDVEKVNPDLVARDKEGKPFTVRYDAVNAMLLSEFLKEHRKVEEQGAIIAKQQKQIEALTAGLQKVSAELETSRASPQMVGNDQ